MEREVETSSAPSLRTTLSVGGVMDYAQCPKRFYWSTVRPLPRFSGPAARIGTRIHAWIERQSSGQTSLIDLDEAPDLTLEELARQPGKMERLQRNCYRLIWLNPLLGLPSYQPLTQGIQAALPYVDDFMPVHNLDSLEALGRHLQRIEGRRPTRRQRPSAEAGSNGAIRSDGSLLSFRDSLLSANGARHRRGATSDLDEPPAFLYSEAPTSSNERAR